jgi:threonine/homoserine/homoserine lactone efflux protein
VHDLLGPLILFSLAMSFTAGPNVVMVTASAANFGFRPVLPHIAGITVGFAAMILASGLGLAGLFQAEPRLHTALKYVGGAYLLYLAWRIANAGASGDGATRARPINFFEAILFQLVNPKGWVSAIGAVAAFSTVGGNVLAETLLIVLVLGSACTASVTVWAAFGVAIGRFLGRPAVRRAFNWSMAALLVLSLVPVFA